MSLTRPAYTFTVENRTQGWTYTTTEGPDPDPDAPVKLLDNMTHKWGFAQDRIPGPFEPATLSFRLGADRVADLPTVHINDVILARLERPLEDSGSPPRYFTFAGRITDPIVALDPHAAKPAQMTVTAVEFQTDLANVFPALPETHAPWDPDVPWSYELFYDLFSYTIDLLSLKTKDRVRTLLPDAWRQRMPPDWSGGHGLFQLAKEHSSVNLGEMLARIADSKPVEYAPGVRYTAYPRAKWHDHPPVPTDAGLGNWYPLDSSAPPAGIFPGWYVDEPVPPNPDPMPDEPGVWYWITPITRHLGPESAVLSLVWPPGNPYATAKIADVAEERDGLIYLDACNVRTPLSARKGREHVVSRVNVNGVDRITRSDSSGTNDQLDVIAEAYPPVAKTSDAAVARSVETTAVFSWSIYLDGAPQPWVNESFRFIIDEVGPAFLSDASVNSQQWSFDSIDVTTWTMTDDELDRIAPQFFPEEPTAGVLYPRVLTQLIVDGIDPEVLTDPPFLTAVVTGATHTITGGRLLIKPNLVGGVLPVNPTTTDAVTAADLTAAGSPWSDLLTAETIDPELTALDFRLIGEPA